jgi:hypothetical protein
MAAAAAAGRVKAEQFVMATADSSRRPSPTTRHSCVSTWDSFFYENDIYDCGFIFKYGL